MRKSNVVTIICASMILLFSLLFFPKNSTPAITYFPLDSEEQFEHAENTLQLQHKNNADKYTVSWKTRSKTSEPFYLRQDVAVLFKDGALIGVKSKWEEDAKTIAFNEAFDFPEDHVFQTIALHYGEKHDPDEEIKSIQQMSYADLYVKGNKRDGKVSFQEPAAHQDMESKNELKNKTKKNLFQHWHRLTSHFQVDLSQYEVVPLTELAHFEDKPLLSYTQSQTDEIIAKLWEGLYKNYIIPASETQNDEAKNYLPLILFGKHENDILVLFELNGEKEKLIQKYPDF